MAASTTDLLTKVGDPGTATTLSAPGYTTGGTSINVGSTTHFPSTTAFVFAIDEVETVGGEEVRVAGTYNTYRGIVSSGTQISSVTWLSGDGDRDYAAGAGTRVYITTASAWANRLIDGLNVSHNPDGTLKDGAVDDAAVLASNVVTTAKIADSNVTTAKIADDAVTPAKWTNPYCFRAYATGSTTLTDNTAVKVALAGESYDYNNNFASSTYTAPVAGVYHFDANLQIGSAVSTGVNCQASIQVNGATALTGPVFVPTNFAASNVSGDILLAANDTVEFYFKQDSAGAEDVNASASATYFSGHLVHAT